MPRRLELLLRRLTKSSLRLWPAAAFVLVLSVQALSQTTTDVLPPPCTDTDYQNCPKLQAGHDSPTKLDGPLSYSFASNADLLATLGSQAAVDDFKTRA